jgi:hypothetical protein
MQQVHKAERWGGRRIDGEPDGLHGTDPEFWNGATQRAFCPRTTYQSTRICRGVQEFTPAHRADCDRLRRQVEDLNRKLDAGVDRISSAPAALVPTLTAKLEELQQQRNALTAKLAAAVKPLQPDDAQREEAEALAGIEALRNLRQSFAESRPSDIRQLLSAVVSRIDLRYQHESQGRKIRHRFVEGIIALRPAISANLKRIVPSSGT